MLSNGSLTCTYDSANRLTSAGGHIYTHNAEDVRIRNRYSNVDIKYTYNTNAKLSQLLLETVNNVNVKYVYGIGLIYEEYGGSVIIHHYDNRGSTVALTNIIGTVTDKFVYDTYGKQISHTGNGFTFFGYNGRDGVITDQNGLIYMRARYYSPDMKRFINADIVKGEITNAVTLNRYAYANANPVTNIDPLGLTVPPMGNNVNSSFSYAIFDDGGGGGTTTTNTTSSSTSAPRDSSMIREGGGAANSSSNATNFIQDAFNDFIDSALDAYETAKEFVVDTYGDAKDWMDENIIQPVTDFISENVEVGANFGVEKVDTVVNHQFGQTERGTGYSKDFNTGKPINIVQSSSANSLNGGSCGLGVDLNFDGYGMGITFGEDISLGAHLGSLSIEFGHSETSLYFKTATKVDGAYTYQKDTFDYKDFGNAVGEVVSESEPYIKKAVAVVAFVLFVVSIPLGIPFVPGL